MAPELVSDPTRVSEKADVWSLGMVLWEMLTLQVPFSHLSPQQIVAGLMVGNLQPEVRLPSDFLISTLPHRFQHDDSRNMLPLAFLAAADLAYSLSNLQLAHGCPGLDV